MSLEPGTRLGPYEVLSLLGKGGMGEVYKATDTRLGRSVAIKVIPESLTANPRYRQRLKREAKTISQLQHPHICILYDIGSEGGVEYLVMEYLEGQTLSARLREGPLPLEEVLRIGGEIADAIAAAHKRGIVHRDLKPGNIMLTRRGTKVLDFGLAKPVAVSQPGADISRMPTLADPITREGAITGTLPYMAPEQLEGKPADLRTDIWALGCILHEMASGQRAFHGDSQAALIHSIMSAEPKSMEPLPSPIPPRLAWVVSRCFETDPEQRWQSGHDLAIELSGISAHEGPDSGRGETQAMTEPVAPDDASAAGSVPSGPAGPGRRRRLMTAAGGVLLAATALAGYWFLRPQPAAPVAAEGTVVAVLPFENLTGDDQLSYIGQGLAAGLISQLSGLPGIQVIGRSRTWKADEEAAGPTEIAELLGANLVIEGEVQASRQGLQVNIATLDGASAKVLWSGSFSGTREGLFDLQQEIGRSVARVLSVSLSAADRRRLTRAGPSARAFDYYLQGIERYEQRANPRHFEFAADLFRQAIRIEGDVAVFHAALSNAISQQHLEGVAQAGSDEAEAEARKALELDPHLPEGHLALARALRIQGHYAESIAQLRPILAEHPKPAEAFLELAFGYEQAGDAEAARQAMESAVAIEPENWFNWNALGATQAEHGDFEGARASLEKALALAPESVTWPRLNLGGVKTALGDYAGAIEDFEATGATTSNPDLASNMATAYFYLGRLEKAESLNRLAVSLDPDNYILHRNLGDVLVALERDQEAQREFRTALRIVEAQITDKPRNSDLLRSRALYAAKTGDCEAAIGHAQAAQPYLLANWKGQLDLAMTFALCGWRDDAIDAVKACVDLGLPGYIIREQAELGSLAEDAEFLALTGPDE